MYRWPLSPPGALLIAQTGGGVVALEIEAFRLWYIWARSLSGDSLLESSADFSGAKETGSFRLQSKLSRKQ
ncbi:hypothetical protein N7540_012192 [Penicillium herquei]|nr:hypothetical protein N7540_012192 [Penicillium herquei]